MAKSSSGRGPALVWGRATDRDGGVAGDVAIFDGDVVEVVIHQDRSSRDRCGGTKGEAVEIKRDVVSGDGDCISTTGCELEILGKVIAARAADSVGQALDGLAGFNLVEGLHGGRRNTGRGERPLGEASRDAGEEDEDAFFHGYFCCFELSVG